MIIFNCRDFDDLDDDRKDWKSGGYITEVWREDGKSITALKPIAKSSQAVVLVHGFNSSPSTIKAAYNQIGPVIEEQDLDVYGFTWPSEANAPGYYWDLCHAHKSKHALIKVAEDLQKMYSKISVICHSMGSILTMEAVRYAPENTFHRIAIHGGDAAWHSFRMKGRYGQNAAAKIAGLKSYYSHTDLVLKIVAKITRPLGRIGEKAMPKNHPANYMEVDAENLTGTSIEHNDYKGAKPILIDTAKWLTSK